MNNNLVVGDSENLDFGATWSGRSLGAVLGIPHRTINSWVAHGLVEPQERGVGRGGHKIGLFGLLEVVAIHELRSAGASLHAIRKAVDNMRALLKEDRPLALLTLIRQGDDILVRWDDVSTAISAYRKPGQWVMVFPLGEKVQDLQQRLNAQADEEEDEKIDEKECHLALASN